MPSAPQGLPGFKAVAVITALSLLTACNYSFEIPVTQVPRLAASAPRPRTVKTIHGNTETLRSDFSLIVIPRSTPMITFEPPVSAEIQGENLVVTGRGSPKPREVPLRGIARLKIQQLSSGNGVAVMLGVLGGAALIAFTIAGFAALSSSRLWDK